MNKIIIYTDFLAGGGGSIIATKSSSSLSPNSFAASGFFVGSATCFSSSTTGWQLDLDEIGEPILDACIYCF